MARVFADYENLAMASDDLALVAHFLDRRTYLHIILPFGYALRLILHTQPLVIVCSSHPPHEWRAFASENINDAQNESVRSRSIISCPRTLFEAIRDTSAIQIVHRQFNRNFIARQNLDVVHSHLPRNMRQYLVSIFKLNLEHCVRQRFENRSLELDYIFFGQKCSFKQVVVKQQ